MAALEGEIGKLQADQLAGMRENLNVLVHNASQIYVPKGDTRHPYEIGRPGNSNYGNLLQTRTDSEGKCKVPTFIDFTLRSG